MFIGTAAANQEQNFSIDASAGPFEDRSDGLTFGLGAAAASFNFSLDFGDRDGDGLLDIWEEEGIDFDGMPPVDIDLSAMGADPDVKDLFVELDVMEGVVLDQSAIDQVIAAFARAPAMDVDNNNAAGINLHVLVDADRPTHTSLVSTDATELPLAYYNLKTMFFGSEADRNHPNAAAIREAWLQIFRYCLWADTLTFELPLTLTPIQALGFSEGIPSNDFIFAAGHIAASYSENVTGIQAGTCMHEFGHTLGLAHGGQDGENFKPNYLSVMNYLYTAPISRMTQQDTNAIFEAEWVDLVVLGAIFNNGFEDVPGPLLR